MNTIGLYTQLTEFTTHQAGTSEWCKAERDGNIYFVKKYLSPVLPTKELGLPEKMYNAGVAEFKEALAFKERVYKSLRENNQSNALVVPLQVMNYQFHICTIADYIASNVSPEQVCLLSERLRLLFMRKLTVALMNVHKAGLVHSDMKPDNLLISQNDSGHYKLHLIDFDGSFFEDEPPADSEEVAGDPAFFAPEVYQQYIDASIRLDHRIDIFALGIIFHYFWCGKYPHKPKEQTIGEHLLRGGIITLDESIPLVLKQLIEQMIALEPNNRISLKAANTVLAVLIDQYPINPSQKMAKVQVNYCGRDGEILMYRTLKIPFGTKKIIDAEHIDGYHLKKSEPKSKEICVDKEGNTISPVTFYYQIDGNKRWLTKAFTVLLLFSIISFILYIQDDRKTLNDRESLITYDATMEIKTTRPTQTATPKPTATRKPKTTAIVTPKSSLIEYNKISYQYDIGEAGFDRMIWDRDYQVSKIQRRLIELGYLDDLADGVFGPKTKDAIERFQRKHAIHGNVNSYGVATMMTQVVLFSSNAISYDDSPRLTTLTEENETFLSVSDAIIGPKKTEYGDTCLKFILKNKGPLTIVNYVTRYWWVSRKGKRIGPVHWCFNSGEYDTVDPGQEMKQIVFTGDIPSDAFSLKWVITEIVYANGEVIMLYDASMTPSDSIPANTTDVIFNISDDNAVG